MNIEVVFVIDLAYESKDVIYVLTIDPRLFSKGTRAHAHEIFASTCREVSEGNKIGVLLSKHTKFNEDDSTISMIGDDCHLLYRRF